MIVCKSFSSAATEVFYQEVSIPEDKMIWVKKLLSFKTEERYQQFYIGKWLKQIELHDSDHQGYWCSFKADQESVLLPTELFTLLSYFLFHKPKELSI
jgi:hypothetical protein